MRNIQTIGKSKKIDYKFMEASAQKEFVLYNGLFHLTFDNGWKCQFVSDNCFNILDCDADEFISSLKNLTAYINGAKKTVFVDELLEQVRSVIGTCAFSAIVIHKNRDIRYIRGALNAYKNEDNRVGIYGQIEDVTTQQEHEEAYRILEKKHKAGMSMSGRSIYRYIIDGRRAIIPPDIAKQGKIPEVIDNLPEYNVECGRIAQESVDDWLAVFDAIERGEKTGAAEVVFWIRGGTETRRCMVEFSNVFDETGQPVFAVISHKDITDEYEKDRIMSIDRAGLLQIAKMSFPEILSVNLTKGTYRMIQYYGATRLGTPAQGKLDDMLDLRLENVAPEDQQAFKDTFYRHSLMKTIMRGQRKAQLVYRRKGRDEVWHWIETTAVLQDNPHDSDVIFIAASRSIDKEKEQETMLRDALADSSAKLDDLMYYSTLGKANYPGLDYIEYDDGRDVSYVLGNLADELGCDPKKLALGTSSRIFEEDKYALEIAKNAAQRSGEDFFRAEYRVIRDDGEVFWVSNHGIRFEDKNGDKGYIHFLSDVTYEHALAEQVQFHLKAQAKKNEQIFNVVAQHSNRILYYYDAIQGTTRPWDEEHKKHDILAHVYAGNYSENELEKNKYVSPESMETVKQFFGDIHGGKPTGEINLQIMMTDGELRWYNFKYSSFFEGDTPAGALISVRDITNKHDSVMSGLRFSQSAEESKKTNVASMEADLTADLIENQTGLELWNSDSAVGKPYSEFNNSYSLGFDDENDNEKAHDTYAIENLLKEYENGVRFFEHIWQVDRPEGKLWIKAQMELVEDPFSGHIKLFVNMSDVTAEEEDRLSVLKRADFDAMTGLLRKDVGEVRIRQKMSESNKAGILIALDLDDLKTINDTLGHKGGDQAIMGIANTMQSHFRRDDILIRMGGDEFMVYLPEAGEYEDSVKISISSLLRKLSGVPIGEDNERYIHCSIGCAVETPGTDTYDSLFKKADMALYHVKRSGKNNFAFYEPAMEEKDFEFKRDRIEKDSEDEYTTQLIDAVSEHFDSIVMFNLTNNHFKILKYTGSSEEIPHSETIDRFWEFTEENIHPDDRETATETLSRNNLLNRYKGGRKTLKYNFRYRQSTEENYYRTEVTVNYYTNERGDICAFGFFRKAVMEKNEKEIMRLEKMVQLSSMAGFEYICLINLKDKSYSVYSMDTENTHKIPDYENFDTVTAYIRDTQIPENERDTYYSLAVLDNVIKQMQAGKGKYSYQYTMTDGIKREALFSWYEDSHSELLMTVRKLNS